MTFTQHLQSLQSCFLLNVSTSDLSDIVGLQGDKNGNMRPRQPGGKDAHGKFQALSTGILERACCVSLMRQSPVNWQWLPGTPRV